MIALRGNGTVPYTRIMALLDRLLPAWRQRDPEVRAAAVREMGRDDQAVLATVARGDTDARVRRIAIKKLDDAALLLEIGDSDADTELRALATTRAQELLVERAISHQPPEECIEALDRVSRAGQRVTIATRAVHSSVRRAALASVTDEPNLAEIARRGTDAEVGLAALERVTDAALLHRVAVGNAPPEVALAALARLTDADLVHAIAEHHHADKSVRKRARAMLAVMVGEDHPLRLAAQQARQVELCAEVERWRDSNDPAAARMALRAAEREWQDTSARADAAIAERFRSACEAVHKAIIRGEQREVMDGKRETDRLRNVSTRQQLCETVEALHGADTPAGLAAARKAWQALGPIEDEESRMLGVRFNAAIERCEQRHERWQTRDTFHAQLAAMVDEAEALVASGDPRAAAGPRGALEKRWARLASSAAGSKWLEEERTLEQRFATAGEALLQQRESQRAERQEREQDARRRLQALCVRLEHLGQTESLTRTAAERALAAAEEAVAHLRALPGPEREALHQQLALAREQLIQRMARQANVEEWERWASAEVQQGLIDQAEALLAADDPGKILRELGVLEREWQRFPTAPRDQSQALWDRFRRARNALRRRADAYLAENLARKEALCVAVDKLADSTEWSTTAAAIRQMQEEWKQIGPVRQRLSAELFARFRTPANRFFERHKEFQRARRAQRDEMLGRMRALCEAAEAVADSTEWETAAAQIKQLQQQARDVWRRRRAPARPEGEKPRPGDLLGDQFYATCDRFFERYRRRDELALQAKLTAAEVVVADVESLQRALTEPDPPPTDAVITRLQERVAEWSRVGPLPPAATRALTERLRASYDAIETACNGFPEGAFDAESNVGQREKICVRLERVLASLRTTTAKPAPSDLAARLTLALAANTIGGSAAPAQDRARSEALSTADGLIEKWHRLGPVIGSRARALAARFEQATTDLRALRGAGPSTLPAGRG